MLVTALNPHIGYDKVNVFFFSFSLIYLNFDIKINLSWCSGQVFDCKWIRIRFSVHIHANELLI